MNKILKIITFLSISMCMLLPNFATYAGGIDKVIRHGENKMTEYVSHARLKKLVEDQKKMKERHDLIIDGTIGIIGIIAQPLLAVYAGMKGAEKIIRGITGDSTFFSNCLQKSSDNGKRGCIIKYTYIVHDETPNEWMPDSCELQ